MEDTLDFEMDELEPQPAAPRRRRFRIPARTLFIALMVVAAISLLVPSLLARIYAIPSSSMETTLHGCSGCDNDRVLVDRLVYRFTDPKPGDVVVFAVPPTWQNTELPPPPEDNLVVGALREAGSVIGFSAPTETDFVKRVIAVGGQTVACCDPRNRLLVDGHPVDESFIFYDPVAGQAEQQPFGPVTVPRGQLWMMGDNRNDSVDSRAAMNGPVPVDKVIGKVRMIVLPLRRFGGLTPGLATPAGE